MPHVRHLTDADLPQRKIDRQRMIVMAQHLVPFTLGIIGPLSLISWLLLH